MTLACLLEGTRRLEGRKGISVFTQLWTPLAATLTRQVMSYWHDCWVGGKSLLVSSET